MSDADDLDDLDPRYIARLAERTLGRVRMAQAALAEHQVHELARHLAITESKCELLAELLLEGEADRQRRAAREVERILRRLRV